TRPRGINKEPAQFNDLSEERHISKEIGADRRVFATYCRMIGQFTLKNGQASLPVPLKTSPA
ncbi:MAG: hypothetical protein E7K65_01180, partial [Pseudomonas sp.]|nr:hypothetical protein [Pseudomonas sp.]